MSSSAHHEVSSADLASDEETAETKRNATCHWPFPELPPFLSGQRAVCVETVVRAVVSDSMASVASAAAQRAAVGGGTPLPADRAQCCALTGRPPGMQEGDAYSEELLSEQAGALNGQLGTPDASTLANNDLLQRARAGDQDALGELLKGQNRLLEQMV